MSIVFQNAHWHNLIYKSKHGGVCLSVVRAGQGRAARADTCPLDLLAARSNRLGGLLAVQTFSSCSPLLFEKENRKNKNKNIKIEKMKIDKIRIEKIKT
jgi:hypothetical protein